MCDFNTSEKETYGEKVQTEQKSPYTQDNQAIHIQILKILKKVDGFRN